jgi:hypothetical protein
MSHRSTTKSALALARTALKTARSCLPTYSCPKSRHDFTQHQLFACLVLMQFLKTDFRGIAALLAEWAELRHVLALKKVPHYSTLCYARRRLLKRGALPTC